MNSQLKNTNNFTEKPWIEKYRPSNFKDIKGQNLVKNTIYHMVKKGILPNLIFHGSPGTGKTSFIFSLAKLIFGDQIDNLVLELNASDDRGINVIRDEIKDFTSKDNLFGSGLKLVILDEADAMTQEAQLALIYLMEKYSEKVRFCLICNYYYKILDSIKSRCSVFRFLPLDNSISTVIIKDILKKEKINLNSKTINKIVKFGQGDIRKSINLCQSICITEKKINTKFINLLIGDISDSEIKKIIKILHDNNIKYRKKFTLILKYLDKTGISLSNLINIVFNNMDDLLSDKIIKLADLEYKVKQSTFSKTYLYLFVAIFQS